MKAIAAISVSALLLVGCAGRPGGNFVGANVPEDAGELPPNYVELVKYNLRNRLKDPDSAKIAVGEGYLGQCQIGIYGPFYGWRVPVDYNAKNSYGGYVGEQRIYYWFAQGHVRRISADPNVCP